jgi:hypothetical protein
MSHKPGHFDDKLRRLDKVAGIPTTGRVAGGDIRSSGSLQRRDPKIWEKYTTPQGYTKWRKKKTLKPLVPRHETKRKGTISGRYGVQ